VQVLVHGDPEAADLILMGQEPGHEVRAVLARLGREVAEPLEHLHPDPPPEPVGVAGHDLPQPRVEVLPAVLQPQDPRLVVEPAREVGDLPERDSQ
jgi:hypothetical protein